MGRKLVRIAGLAIFLAAAHVPAAHAQTRFSFGIGIGRPAPVYVAPYDDYYWEPAHRVWVGGGYRWVPGRWVRRGYGSRWERERWRRERYYSWRR